MKQAATILVLVALFACTPEAVDSHSVFDSLVRAERAFANTSITSTTRNAFLTFLASDAILFGNGPTDGRALWEARPETESVLSWGPEIAFVSRGGDMGYTSGPWEVRANADAASSAWGHFISVWKRNANGDWKVAIDGGISHGQVELHGNRPVEWAGPEDASSGSNDVADVEARSAELREVDDAYSTAVSDGGFSDNLDSFVSPDARFFRNGYLPLVGKGAILESNGVIDAVWDQWEFREMDISDSADLAFTCGVVQLRAESTDAGPTPSASYYRIWRSGGPFGWSVVVDVLIPINQSSQ